VVVRKVSGAVVELEPLVGLLAEFGIAAMATDLTGTIREWNRPAADLYGREAHEMLGVSVSTLRLSDGNQSISASVVRELLEMGRWHGEIEVQDAAGLALRLGVRARVVVDGGDQPVGFEAAFSELGDRREPGDQGAESEPGFDLSNGRTSVGSWEWDPAEHLLTTSDPVPDVLGFTRGRDLTMAGVLEAMPSEDRTRVHTVIDGARSGASDVSSVVYRVNDAEGQLRWLDAHWGAVHSREGVLTRVWGTTRDITERVRTADQLRDAVEFWQGTLDSLSARIAILDDRGDIVAVNAAWRRFAESANGSDFVGRNYVAVCEAAAADPVAKAVARGLKEVLAGERTVLEVEYPCHSPSMQRWFQLRATTYAGPGPLRVVVAHEDITDRRLAEQRLFMQAALLDEIDVSVIVTDMDLRVVTWNAGAERLYGWKADEVIGRHVSETMWPTAADPESVEQATAALHREGRSDDEYLVRRQDGSTFLAHVRSRVIRDQDGCETAVANVAIDITELKESERALLSARKYLQAVTDSMGEGLFTMDGDGRGKYMNHVAQDQLGWSMEELEGQRLHDVLHSRRLDGTPLPFEECPIRRAYEDGAVVRVEDDVFVRRDGSALPVAYTAAPFSTDNGVEGCVVLFEDITERKAATLRIERDLEKLSWLERIQEALAEKRFVLYAQPIIDLKTGDVVQREMLLRMRDRDEPGTNPRVVAPGLFLPVAEEFGLITEIDHWVIDRSTELAATGQAVEINVSGRSVSDPDLVGYIKHAMERAGADPEKIVFEITETTLVSDEAAARAFVEGLHSLGCKVALDDFGTGYGGFTYLKQLPIDFLKIDIEFVRDLRSNTASRHVVEAIVNLATRFSLKTVGEGAEDQETVDLLRELGVDYAQGFHIGRPAPLEVQSATTTEEQIDHE
jgi:PAS domain S-box-containing protein